MASTVAVFPGSFDPLTNGHTDIIERALNLFDRIVVGVLTNPVKDPLFTVEERIALIREACKKHGDRLIVESFSGLLVEFVKSRKTNIVIRGLRAVSDYEYEAQIALINKRLSKDIETLFLMATEENAYVSSSVVKQVAKFKGDVSALVPSCVADALKLKSDIKLSNF